MKIYQFILLCLLSIHVQGKGPGPGYVPQEFKKYGVDDWSMCQKSLERVLTLKSLSSSADKKAAKHAFYIVNRFVELDYKHVEKAKRVERAKFVTDWVSKFTDTQLFTSSAGSENLVRTLQYEYHPLNLLPRCLSLVIVLDPSQGKSLVQNLWASEKMAKFPEYWRQLRLRCLGIICDGYEKDELLRIVASLKSTSPTDLTPQETKMLSRCRLRGIIGKSENNDELWQNVWSWTKQNLPEKKKDYWGVAYRAICSVVRTNEQLQLSPLIKTFMDDKNDPTKRYFFFYFAVFLSNNKLSNADSVKPEELNEIQTILRQGETLLSAVSGEVALPHDGEFARSAFKTLQGQARVKKLSEEKQP